VRAAMPLRQLAALARAPRVGLAALQAVRAGFAAPGSGQEAWRCQTPFLPLVAELEPVLAALKCLCHFRPSRRSWSCALSIGGDYCFRQAPAPVFLFQLFWRMSPDFWRGVPRMMSSVFLSLQFYASLRKIRVCVCANE
jgi:hypothetical protein